MSGEHGSLHSASPHHQPNNYTSSRSRNGTIPICLHRKKGSVVERNGGPAEERSLAALVQNETHVKSRGGNRRPKLGKQQGQSPTHTQTVVRVGGRGGRERANSTSANYDFGPFVFFDFGQLRLKSKWPKSNWPKSSARFDVPGWEALSDGHRLDDEDSVEDGPGSRVMGGKATRGCAATAVGDTESSVALQNRSFRQIALHQFSFEVLGRRWSSILA